VSGSYTEKYLYKSEIREVRTLPADHTGTNGAAPELSHAFYVQVFTMLTSTSPGQDFWSIRQFILRHAFEQLRAGQKHFVIALPLCVPPSKDKVRSLYTSMGIGKPTWGGDMEQQSIFMGSETVAGQVVSSGHSLTITNFQEPRWLTYPNRGGIAGLSVFPLRRAGRIAGTFTVMSTRPEYFLPSRLALIEEYSNLVALTLPDEAFYEFKDIELGVMPLPHLQAPYLSHFRERVLQVLREATTRGQPMNNAQAELLVRHHLEEELFLI